MKKYYYNNNGGGKQVNNGGASPERAKVWTEKSPKYQYNAQGYHNRNQSQKGGNGDNSRVPVVYYLCRNRQLEHPHFIEVPLSSPDGLYLRGNTTQIFCYISKSFIQTIIITCWTKFSSSIDESRY